MKKDDLDALCLTYETYLSRHFFDGDGLLYSYLDSRTGEPFRMDYLSTQKLGKLACDNPEEYFAYEDSMMCYGFYLTCLYEKYQATGDAAVLARMGEVYEAVARIYAVSQRVEKGFFGRPYGGLSRLEANREPLGTDQMAPLMSGLWLYRSVAPGRRKKEIDEMVVSSLEWYRKQGYEYLYYKFLIHRYWQKGFSHALNYYLPCALWAYRATGEEKYLGDYGRFLAFVFYSLSGHEISFTFRFRFWLEWLAENGEDRGLWKDLLLRIAALDRKLLYNDHEDNVYYEAYLRPGSCFVDEFNLFVAPDGYSYRPTAENPDGAKPGRLDGNDLVCGYLRMAPSALLANIAGYSLRNGKNGRDIEEIGRLLALYDTVDDFTEVRVEQGRKVPEGNELSGRSLAAKHLLNWLTAYWRLRQLQNG